MAKIFKKLFSGDTVATYDGKVVKKLTTEEPTTDDSIVGTWVFNDAIVYDSTWTSFYASFYSNNTEYKRFTIGSYDMSYVTTAGGYQSAYIFGTGVWGTNKQTVNIVSVDTTQSNYSVFVTWLKANATKQ